MRVPIAILFTFFSFTFSGFAQTTLKLPVTSPRAKVSYTIGVTEVTIDYGAPGVKNRSVYGQLVPYGQVWRAGANEATTIKFSTEVRISQERIPAGTYTLFVLPSDSVNWTLILSKQKGLWGTEGYDPKQDLIRLPFASVKAPFHETLQYTVQDIQTGTGRLTLNWADRALSVFIRTDVHEQTLHLIKDTLQTAKPKDWSVYAQAVSYLLQQNKDHELALQWINQSIEIEENFFNTWLKAKLLAQNKEYLEALELNRKAQKLGKKAKATYQTYAHEIEDDAVLWKEKRFDVN